MSTDSTPHRAALTFAWVGGGLFVLSLAYFLYLYLVRWNNAEWRSAHFDSIAAIAVDVLMFGGFALHHSALARPRAKRMVARIIPPRLERSVYVWIASLLFAAICTLWQPVPGEWYDHRGLMALAHAAIVGIAFWIIAKSAALLDPLELAGIRQLVDSEKPARESVPLTSRGPYGLVRHPIYLGWGLLVFGVPHMTFTRLAFACISTLYLLVAIPFEERALVSQFGMSYEQYRRRIRWRVVPFVY